MTSNRWLACISVLALLLLTAANKADEPKKDDPPALEGTVIQALDGGHLLVQPDGKKDTMTVRLIGLEVPAKASREKEGQEPWGTRAQQWLALRCVRKEVRVELDVVVPVDNGATRWGYVWLIGKDGDKLLNEEVLKAGHAVLDTRPPNVKYVERLRAAQGEAREGKKGVWDPDEPLPDSPAEFAKKQKDKEAEAKEKAGKVETLAQWQAGCCIGNSKTKKFHVPGGQYYDGSKDSKNALFFKNAADAEKAGYTKSAR